MTAESAVLIVLVVIGLALGIVVLSLEIRRLHRQLARYDERYKKLMAEATDAQNKADLARTRFDCSAKEMYEMRDRYLEMIKSPP